MKNFFKIHKVLLVVVIGFAMVMSTIFENQNYSTMAIIGLLTFIVIQNVETKLEVQKIGQSIEKKNNRKGLSRLIRIY